MAKQDYYEILGISRSASANDIKKSYRKLAMKYHPDHNPENRAAEHRFKNINEAYEALRDEDKRAAYDQQHGQGGTARRGRSEGTATYPDGSTYVGEWKDGKKHGQGTYTTAGGAKYVGEWKEGKRHGQGTSTYPDGGTYSGEWKDGKRNGQGTYTTAGGAVKKGTWRDNKFLFVDDYEKGFEAYKTGDYDTALRELRPLAAQGDTKAMFNLGCMYAEGEGVAQDYVLAYMWFDLRLKLTTAQEEESWFPGGEISLRKNQLAEVAAMMTPGQVAEAQYIALALLNKDRIPLQQWMEKHPK